MKYLIRHTYQCKRGEGPAYLENLKILLSSLRSGGLSDIKFSRYAGNLLAFTRSEGAGPMLGRNCIKKAYTSAMTGSST